MASLLNPRTIIVIFDAARPVVKCCNHCCALRAFYRLFIFSTFVNDDSSKITTIPHIPKNICGLYEGINDQVSACAFCNSCGILLTWPSWKMQQTSHARSTKLSTSPSSTTSSPAAPTFTSPNHYLVSTFSSCLVAAQSSCCHSSQYFIQVPDGLRVLQISQFLYSHGGRLETTRMPMRGQFNETTIFLLLLLTSCACVALLIRRSHKYNIRSRLSRR